MKKNLLGYGFLLVVTIIMLLFSGRPYLLGVLILLLLMAIEMAVFTRRDAQNLKTYVYAEAGAQDGRENKYCIEVSAKKKLFAARYLLVNLCEKNEMFGTEKERRLLFRLNERSGHYEVPFGNKMCGEVQITCNGVWVCDLLKLFQMKVEPFTEIRTIIYPRKTALEIELSRTTVGAPRTEGIMQNRRGNDPSEIYDIREYVPGDDIRSIHWKLSSKMENLVLKEASDPSHYNVVLLPDFGQNLLEEKAAEEIVNAAVAVGVSIGERLAEKRVSFCIALPAANGLKLCEVKDRREMQKVLTMWLSCPVAPKSGDGLRCFMMEHLEQYFTRLLILTGGEYRQNVSGLEERIGVTVLHVSESAGGVNADDIGGCEIVEIPADIDNQEAHRIRC